MAFIQFTFTLQFSLWLNLISVLNAVILSFFSILFHSLCCFEMLWLNIHPLFTCLVFLLHPRFDVKESCPGSKVRAARCFTDVPEMCDVIVSPCSLIVSKYFLLSKFKILSVTESCFLLGHDRESLFGDCD